MANPITWRNVQARGNSDAAYTMNSAVNTIGQSFDSIGKAIGNVQDSRQAEYDFGVDQNTNAYLDAVSKLGTPEEVKAAQESGQLDKLKASFGNQYDDGATRGALDAQLTKAYQQTNAADTFEKGQLEKESTPIVDRILGLARTDPVAAAAEASANETVLRNSGRLNSTLQQITEIERGNINQARADEEQRRTDQTRDFKSLIAQAVEESDGPVQARARAQELAVEAGMEADIINSGLSEVTTAYNNRFGLTPQDSANIENFETQIQATVQAAEQSIDTEYQAVIATNPVNEVFSFTDEGNLTTGEAITYARDTLGVDNKALKTWSENAVDYALDTFSQNAGITEDDLKSVEPAMGRILKEAFSLMGVDEDIVTSNDLESGTLFGDGVEKVLKETVAGVLDKYWESERNRKRVEQATMVRNRDLAMARGQAANSIVQYRDGIRKFLRRDGK